MLKMLVEEHDFLVHIRCITYNHSSYIVDALNGFCIQKTSFPFVAIVIDDASPDGEQDVIRRYVEANFNMRNANQWDTEDAHFIFAQHKNNSNCFFAVVLLKYNFYQLNKSKEPLIKRWTDTKYIAFCEGDDYWIDTLKIQKQVSYLEDHSGCNMIYTDIKQYIQKDHIFQKSSCKQSNFEEMLWGTRVATPTVCIRKKAFDDYIEDREKIKKHWLMGDVPLWLYLFANGSPFFLDEITTVYRVLENSMCHFKDFRKREMFYKSSLDVRLYYAKRYGRQHLLPEIVRYKIGVMINDAERYHANTKFFFTPLFLKYHILDMNLYFQALLSHNFRIKRYVNGFMCFIKSLISPKK